MNRGWVELPDCTGASGEVVLEEDLEFGHSPINASSATCKPRAAAFAHITREENSRRGWVELPDCTGASGEVVLEEDLEFGHSPINASSATCKPRAAAF